jgi:hypothetical protein
MAANPNTTGFNWRVITVRVVALVLFVSGLVEVVYASDQLTVRREVAQPLPPQIATTTPDGVQVEIVQSSVVEVRLNPLVYVAGLQITAGLALFWLARERPARGG